MANLKTDSPLSRRIARSFLHFLNSVEPSAGVDSEALDVAKDCLIEVFKIDRSSLDSQSNCDSLVDIFSASEANIRHVVDHEGVSNAPPTLSLGKDVEITKDQEQDNRRELHSHGKDELFGQFFGALEKIHYFRRTPDGNDDQIQVDRATHLFHNAVEEMQVAGCQTFDQKSLAEAFKSQGNKAMQSKLYKEAIELYTFAIALCEDNAVYYCNRAAAYTQIQRYAEAVRDCLKSMEINPNYSKAYSRLGFAYYAQGRYRDAIDKGFMKALQLDPNNESVKENIRVAEQKLREEQQRAGSGQGSTSTSYGYYYGGGSMPFNNSAAPPPFTSMPFNNSAAPPPFTSMPFNNSAAPPPFTSMPFNSSAAPPPFTSMPFNNSAAPPPFTSMPFNINGLTAGITSMMMNMAGDAQNFQNGPQQERQAGDDNEPGIRVGENINFNVNQLPEDFEELSGAFQSMMGMFPGAAPQANQQDESNRRPSPNS